EWISHLFSPMKKRLNEWTTNKKILKEKTILDIENATEDLEKLKNFYFNSKTFNQSLENIKNLTIDLKKETEKEFEELEKKTR
ncbi:unnamed protein product, partial [marine sediment metagenome]